MHMAYDRFLRDFVDLGVENLGEIRYNTCNFGLMVLLA
jgi:hypothetical protein